MRRIPLTEEQLRAMGINLRLGTENTKLIIELKAYKDSCVELETALKTALVERDALAGKIAEIREICEDEGDGHDRSVTMVMEVREVLYAEDIEEVLNDE